MMADGEQSLWKDVGVYDLMGERPRTGRQTDMLKHIFPSMPAIGQLPGQTTGQRTESDRLRETERRLGEREREI